VYTERKVGNDIKQYFTFWALTEDEARKIEEQDNKSRGQKTCRKMAKKVCQNNIHNEDKDSLWKDAEFIRSISGCSFDVSKVEERVKKGKESLVNDKIMDGLGSLFT
jgi:peroxiredoxin family protein